MKLASKSSCSGCSACFAICSNDAISMRQDEEGFLQPVVDSSCCTNCGLCEEVCPCLKDFQKDETPRCYALKISDRKILMSSTSGGAFSIIAKPILESSGCVYGCVIQSPGLYVCHTKAESWNELDGMRGSKYVQSDLKNTFRECRQDLEKGRNVLFSGTPCQIAGLKSFLGRSYNNLTTVDLICHGIPSPGVFERYKREIEQSEKSTIRNIVFRNKDVEKRYSLSLTMIKENEKDSYIKYDRTFFNAFINDLCLRKSCYNCRFREGRSGSDYTIADFWQIEKCNVGLEYGVEGVSLVIAHTDKAKSSMKGQIEVPFVDALRGNASYFKAPVLKPSRNIFFNLLKNNTVKTVTKKILEGPWYARCIKYIIRLTKYAIKRLLEL